jgi:uncharacterized membrane protein
MKLLSTRTHGVLDLLTAGTMAALPRIMGYGDRVTRTMTNWTVTVSTIALIWQGL